MTEPERTLSVRQAAEASGVSVRCIYNWLQQGKLRFKRTVGGSVRIFESSLWLPDGAESPKHPAKPGTSSSN